jgi:hypothetical protein
LSGQSLVEIDDESYAAQALSDARTIRAVPLIGAIKV